MGYTTYYCDEEDTDPDAFACEENHNEAYQRYADKMASANKFIKDKAVERVNKLQDSVEDTEFHQDMNPYNDSEPALTVSPRTIYQHHVENFINPTVKNSPHAVRCTIAALGLCGESGEVADHIKKHVEQGHPFKLASIVEELGDVLFYVAAMCNANNLSMDEVMDYNIAKLTKRYPNGFSTEASLNRKKDG